MATSISDKQRIEKAARIYDSLPGEQTEYDAYLAGATAEHEYMMIQVRAGERLRAEDAMSAINEANGLRATIEELRKENEELRSRDTVAYTTALQSRVRSLEEGLREIHAWTAFNVAPSAEQISEMRKSIDTLLTKQEG